MGKYILLITFSAALGLTYLTQQSQRLMVSASEKQGERQRTVLARQIARSAFERGASQVRQAQRKSNSWPPAELSPVPEEGKSPPEYQGGEFEITYQKTGGDVLVGATGRYGSGEKQAEYKIRGKAVLEKNSLFGGVTFEEAVASANLSGNPSVIGNDAGPDGDDTHAIIVQSSKDRQTLLDNGFCEKPGNIRGVDGECDIAKTEGSALDEINESLREAEKEDYEEEDICEAKGNAEVGSYSNPAFINVDDECKISGNVSGAGIMYVEDGEGDLTITGNVDWRGIIFMGGEEDGKEEESALQTGKEAGKGAGAGSVDVEGTVAFYGSGQIDLRGNSEIQYNRNEIRNALEEVGINLAEQDREDRVAIEDRCGGVFPLADNHPCSESP